MMEIPADSETALIACAQQGDRGAYSELVRRHSTSVINLVYRMCGDLALAEDAAQEAFIKAWLHLPSYRQQGSFKNWLYRIAINTALDVLRRQPQLAASGVEDLEFNDPQPDPEVQLIHQQQAELVQQAVMSLPPASRAVVVLREYKSLSYQEIAAVLDIPTGTVMSRLSYARGLLRQKLADKLPRKDVAYA